MGFLFRSDVLFLVVLSLPFVAAALILCTKRVLYSQEVISIVFSFALVPITLSLYNLESQNPGSTALLYQVSHAAMLILKPEALGMAFGILVSLLWAVTTIYTVGYMNKVYGVGEDRATFYAAFASSIGCTMGIAFSGNLVTLFIFYETLTICTYPLIIHGKSPTSLASGNMYIKALMCSSVSLFLPAIALIHGVDAEAALFDTSHFIAGKYPRLIPVISLMLCYGVAKAAIMPLHVWLPRAMVAPTPVSALLHAVAVVKSGVFTIVKVTVYVLGLKGMYNYTNHSLEGGSGLSHGNILMYLSAVTIVCGSLFATKQTNLKKMLAYSTVSQLSYVLLALSMYTHGALYAAVFQLVSHALAKITLFFAVGAIYAVSGKTEIEDMCGMGRKMPLTLSAFTLGAFAMIGIPPASTLWGKHFILSEAVALDSYLVIFTVIASTLLNTIYFIPVIYKAFFGIPEIGRIREAPLPILVAMLATSAGIVSLFFNPDLVSCVLSDMGFSNIPG